MLTQTTFMISIDLYSADSSSLVGLPSLLDDDGLNQFSFFCDRIFLIKQLKEERGCSHSEYQDTIHSGGTVESSKNLKQVVTSHSNS